MDIEIRFKQNVGGSCSIKQNSTLIQVPDSEERVTITIDPNVSYACNKCREQDYRQYVGYGAGQLF